MCLQTENRPAGASLPVECAGGHDLPTDASLMGSTFTIPDLLRSFAGRSGIAALSSRLIHSPRTLRILIYHDVPASLFRHFESHLAWLSQRFEFARPDELIRETSPGNRPRILLTFDDGCSDNYATVAPLLESYGARGLFFVCPGFADLSRQESLRLMERSAAIMGATNRDSRWERLSRAQIIDLDRRGHGIGSHTMTHVPLARVTEDETIKEVEECAALLASWLEHPCHYFAWTYSWDEITPKSLKLALDCHKFCFSPCSGLNPWPRPPRLLWRTAVDVSKPLPYLQTQISGLPDQAYRSKRAWLKQMRRSVAAP